MALLYLFPVLRREPANYNRSFLFSLLRRARDPSGGTLWEWDEHYSPFSVLDQCPSLTALVTQPISLHLHRFMSYVTTCVGRFLRNVVYKTGFHQKKLALAQSKKWSRALRICAVAEHRSLQRTFPLAPDPQSLRVLF